MAADTVSSAARVRRVVASPRAELRIREAAGWLAARAPGEEVLIVAASHDAAAELSREVALARGAGFGWHRLTLGAAAAELANGVLAERGLVPVGALPCEAVAARVIQRLGEDGRLGRLAAVVDQPGLPRALARTLRELREAGATDVPGEPEIEAALVAFDAELVAARLADRALVYRIAAEIAGSAEPRHALVGRPLLLLDVPVRTAVEAALVGALAARAPDVLATVPGGDDRTARALRDSVGEPERMAPALDGSLGRVQHQLFAPEPARAELDDSVAILSAPGESRECLEIARRVLREAEAGVPFDQIAVLLRAPAAYRVHLQEAFGRAGIPVHFDRGTVLPDPSGRAFLALLACAAEGLSARRFAEYLSLGEVPDARDGAPPPAAPPADRWVPPDDDLVPRALAGEAADFDPDLDDPPPRTDAPVVAGAPPAPPIAADVDAPVVAGTLRAPWRWERLLVEASVIGGRDRWARRLAGLEAQLALDDGEDRSASRERRRRDLGHLRGYALPLIDELAALPPLATWGAWLDRLAALATRALRRPERVLGVLAAFAPMHDVGPIELAEVQRVLHAELAELVVRPSDRRYGRVFVAAVEAARGLAFDVVFVPGLAERMFPQKLTEDPLLLDDVRARLGRGLATRDDRLADERLALRLAVGAARRRLVLSYPRFDLEQGRPRVPSFYGLEILEAAEGTLPGFDELSRRADATGAARIGWPAPAHRMDAIDEAEHDLALLDEALRSETPPTGVASYLVHANRHLARALRVRGRRWEVRAWKPSDGLIAESAEGRAALAAHALGARSFSPTALEQLAACPYRFALRAIARLEPRDDPAPVESLGALERGSLVHEVQFELLGELRAAGALPVRAANLEAARDRLDAVLDRVAARYRDELCPAIDRVWTDGIASIRADLREWLRRSSEDVAWSPRQFELAFGLAGRAGRDPASVDQPVTLDVGIQVRGSIDLVEVDAGGRLRATDHKTGKPRVEPGAVIRGGTSLQPVLYALALEQLFPGAEVAGGRLSYCTARGGFEEVTVPLDGAARDAARVVATTLAHHVEQAFFPAAPDERACEYCDYRLVCGPYEELRVKRKQPQPLAALVKLRRAR